MNFSNIAIKVENLSKLYRIGMKDELNDSFARTIFDFFKSPLSNYRKYRSLYKFDDLSCNHQTDSNAMPSDIIWALKNVSFEVRQGEVLGIIGSNGAGKSTLLKILSRISDPTYGKARIQGRVSSLIEVGTGFHQELTGRENVYLNGTVLGMKKKEVERKFDEIVDFSGVEKFIDTPVKRYSSGMKVRLAFSVAAHLEPEVLIIDEVLAVGDASFQKKCLNKMHDVSRAGRTVLFVSHNMMAVTRLCSRAILIEEGSVMVDDLPDKVVSVYLGYDFEKVGERKWPDTEEAPGGEIVRLKAVRVRSEDGSIPNVVNIDEPFIVEIEYRVLKAGYILLPNFQFYNEEDTHIFSTHDVDSEWRLRSRPVGDYVSSVNIPGNLLTVGSVRISLGMQTVDPEIFQFHLQDAVTVEVIESYKENTARGVYKGKIMGVVRPLLIWSTTFGGDGFRTIDSQNES
jgi:lipopolysaccharide transport system ATP-binding protein